VVGASGYVARGKPMLQKGTGSCTKPFCKFVEEQRAQISGRNESEGDTGLYWTWAVGGEQNTQMYLGECLIEEYRTDRILFVITTV